MAGATHTLAKHWYHRSALAWLLWPASLAFRIVAVARRLRYRVAGGARVRVPVIVIGNLVAGGSGKTPLALWVATFLKKNGWSPGIVSRGYGGSATLPRAATIASDPAEVGDEPMLLARRSGCPVWVGADRVRVVQVLLTQSPECDVVVLDDGLQHYRLARDIEICVVDSRGFGNGFMLPAGPLREPRSRLESVDAVVAHGTDAVKGYAMRLEGEQIVNLANVSDVRPAKSLAGAKVHAVAGIGDPKRFFLHLAKLGLQPLPHPFPDHHPFSASDLHFGDDLPVVMTEKDAVKCKRFAKPAHWVLPVNAALDPAFGDWLLRRLGEKKRQ